MAEIVGRQFRGKKIPYNRNKTLAGSIAMASAGFLASAGYASASFSLHIVLSC